MAMNYDEILVPDRLYEIGQDIQPGYFLFSNLGIEDGEHLDVHFNMYPDRPPVSLYRRANGYFGVAKLTEECKYCKVEYGRALYYGKPFNLYEVLNSVILPDSAYHPEGVIALQNELCTIKIFKHEKNTYLYHGSRDAEVYEQYFTLLMGTSFGLACFQ